MKKTKRDLHAEVTSRFIDALSNGSIPWIKPWNPASGTVGGFPVNAANGRQYRGINITILWSAAIDRGFTRDRWLTYRQAQNVGGHVKRFEKGTPVVLYRTIESKSADTDRPDDEPRKFKVARCFTLFNVDQCAALPGSVMGNAINDSPPSVEFPEVEAMVKRCGAKIRHGGNAATYYPPADVIQLPPAESFNSAAHYYCTLLHELTHWTGHKSRLNRPGIVESHSFNSVSYAFEELVAEIGSAFLCAELGIQGDLRHESYVQSWIKILEDKPRAIFQASAAAQAAFDFLISIGNAAEAA